MQKLIDPFNRSINYLRVSVTDRCDFRCLYCMTENMNFLPKKELLTLEELDFLCSSFINMGVEKLRITGGEPLVRRNIMSFFQSISRHLKDQKLKELTWLGEEIAFRDFQFRACVFCMLLCFFPAVCLTPADSRFQGREL